jgi:hypothetical protein
MPATGQIPFVPLAMGTRPGGVITPGAKLTNTIGGEAIAGTTGLTQITLDATYNTDTDGVFVAGQQAPGVGFTVGISNSGSIITITTRQGTDGAVIDVGLMWLVLRMPKRT